MVPSTYDFAVLGDTQPEGLMVAAGLVRKGFSVLVVPSSALGELAPDETKPLVLPAQLGPRNLSDLLFRAGFFRLEESGLVSSVYESQAVLPKHRLSFDGTYERFKAEVEREFPLVAAGFMRIWDNLKKPGVKSWDRAAADVYELMKKDSQFYKFIEMEIETQMRPKTLERDLVLIRDWLRFAIEAPPKAYRVDPKMKQPYCSFLTDHARKWGVQLWNDRIDLQPSWSTYRISPNTQVKQLIVNGLGAGRNLAKTFANKLSVSMRWWMFIDRIEISLASTPEPLQEFVNFDFGIGVKDQPSLRTLYTTRDRARGDAILSLGSWLDFEDSKAWVAQIEAGRQSLKRLMPFLPENAFKTIPATLELTEMRGECVRRGQMDRLIPAEETISRFSKLMMNLKALTRRERRLQTVGKRIYVVTPHYLPYRNRISSFHEALKILDHFDRKKHRVSALS